MGRVIEIDQLETVRDELRASGQRIVFTNGHFDLLHTGHLRYLQEARGLGDLLIVGINDDATTGSRKGPRRPIVSERDRAELVAGLACVDYAVIFHEATATRVVERLEPDVYVKGGDYSLDLASGGSPLPEAETVQAYGGEVRIIPLTPCQSTTAIEQRIVDLWMQFGRDSH